MSAFIFETMIVVVALLALFLSHDDRSYKGLMVCVVRVSIMYYIPRQ